MRETLTVDDSAALVDLWRRRQRLAPAEMGRMYAIVSRALQGCNSPELHVLGEGRQELIAQFIYVKVLRLDAKSPDAPEGEAAEEAGQPPRAEVPQDEDDPGDGGRIDGQNEQGVAGADLAEEGDDRIVEKHEEQGQAPGQAEGDEQVGNECFEFHCFSPC